jgi:hypothetical protein
MAATILADGHRVGYIEIEPLHGSVYVYIVVGSDSEGYWSHTGPLRVDQIKDTILRVCRDAGESPRLLAIEWGV